MDLNKLHNEITEEIAHGLHYLDNVEMIVGLKTAAEVQAAVEGGMDRYMNDPIFRRKVQTLVARVMTRVSAAAE